MVLTSLYVYTQDYFGKIIKRLHFPDYFDLHFIFPSKLNNCLKYFSKEYFIFEIFKYTI